MALSFCVSAPLNQTQTRLLFRKSGISHRFPVRGVIYGECEKAPSSVPLVCHPSPSLRRAHDVLPCSIPLLHALQFLSISPQTLSTLSSPFLSSSTEDHKDFHSETRLSTPVSDSHETYMTFPQHISKAFTLLTHTLPIPLLPLHLSFCYAAFHSHVPPRMLFFSFSPTCPFVFYYSSDAHRPHLER